MFIGKNGGGIESQRSFKVQRIECPQVGHRQEPSAAEDCPIKSSNRNTVKPDLADAVFVVDPD